MLDEILNPTPEPVEKVEALAEEAPQVAEPVEGAPTAPQNEQHVPLAALEAERKGRQDWKEKAIRFEEELKHLREQGQAPQQPAQQLDPVQQLHQSVVNQNFNISENLLRMELKNDADVDAAVGVFMEAAKANPALSASLAQQRHPWKFAYEQGKQMGFLKEVGNDPTAYRAKIEAEVEARLAAKYQTAPQVALPASLNGARSVAPRSAGAWTGPPPLDSIANKH